MATTLETTLREITGKDRGGFLLDIHTATLRQHDRLRQLLVRCGNCRFVAAAQDVDWLIGIIERDGQDYVRDVSLPCSDPAYRGDFRPVTNDPPRPTRKAIVEPLGGGAIVGAIGANTRGNCSWGEPSDADPGL